MKIEIQTQKLKEIMRKIEHIAGKHATLPVLSCILIEYNKNTAIFKATNLDVGIEVVVPIKSENSGLVAIPAHTLGAFITQLPDQSSIVSLEIEAGNVKITTPQSSGVIKTVSSEDFPTIPKISEGKEVEIDADIFVKGLKSVWYSSSVSSIKPELSSVYIYNEGEYIVFAATDSFRLAEKKVKSLKTTKISDILIPFRNIADVIRLLEIVNGTIKITISKNLVSFEKDGTYLVSRVIDGVFPDYHQIIPKSFITEAVILKQDFINALKISNIFSDKFNQVRLVIDPKKKIFNIQTKNSDIGENKTLVSAALTGESIEVNFNYKYIADCFQSIEADSISLQLSGLNKPMIIRPVSGDQTFLYIVMPMNR